MSKKRNKKYKGQKPVVLNPINYFISGLQRISPSVQTDLNCKNHMAMLNMTQGRADRADWEKLVGMINIATILCECGTGTQYEEMLDAGSAALQAVGKRYCEINKFVLKGNELQALNDALEVHDAQIEASRVIDVERAFNEVQRRIERGINVKHVMGVVPV